MVYPGRPYPDPLPEFAGTATTRPTPEQRQQLIEHCARRYREGASLRTIAAETDRTQTAIRRALTQAGVPLRQPGAPRISRQ